MIEHLSELYQLSSDTGVTFVYCNFKEPRTPATYIRLAIKQLCRRMECLPPKLESVYEKHYRNDSQPNLEELQSIFLAAAKHFSSMFLVLDALDECNRDQRVELCDFFSKIIELSALSSPAQGAQSPPTHRIESGVENTQPTCIIKLLVTSRKEQDIERIFGQQSFPTVELEAKKVDCDIAIYVKSQLEQRIQDKRLILKNPALKDKILSTLTTKSGGM